MMKSFHFPRAAVVLLMALIGVGLTAKPDDGPWHKDWTELGSKSVERRHDRDEVRCAEAGPMRSIVIEVERAAVNFESVTIEFGHGAPMDVPIRSVIRPGDRTREIDLPGEARVIRKIIFRYRTVGPGPDARVVVWGKLGDRNPPRPDHPEHH